MERRAKKQTFIILILLAGVFLIGFTIYAIYFRSAATCFDGKHNQDEEGVDCGGPCVPCEVIGLRKPEIIWVRAVPTTGGNYDLVAKISNPNQNHGARKMDYEFKVFDQSDNLTASVTGSNFILPREEKYLLELKVPAGGNVGKINLSINETQWERLPDYEPLNIEILERRYEVINSDSIYSHLTGILKNSERQDFNNVTLKIVLFDAHKEPLAVNSSEITGLKAKQERYFDIPWFFNVPGNVVSVDIEPEISIKEQILESN